MRIALFSILGLLTACPDPNASSSGSEVTNSATGNQANNTENGGLQETDPSAARLNCAEGDENCITISGVMTYVGNAQGSIRVDVQKIREGSSPMLVHTLELQATNQFSFDAPKDYGKIIVTGFIDEAGDGPSPKDPQGRQTIEILKEDISGIDIEVKADNAPVQPKPPGDVPDGDPNAGNEGNKAPEKDSTEKTPAKETTNIEKEAPSQNGPPADE